MYDGRMRNKSRLSVEQVHDVMNQSMLLSNVALGSTERRVTSLAHGFVGADLTSNDHTEANAEPETESVDAATATAADTNTTDDTEAQ